MLKKIVIRLLLTVLFAFIGMLGGFMFLVVTGLRGDSETMLTPIVWGFWLGGVFGLLAPAILSRGTTRPVNGQARSTIKAGQKNTTCPERETTGLRDL